MTIEKTFQGAILIRDVVDGYMVYEQYMGYTKREAVKLFKQKYYGKDNK